jgi:hypothetical protein
MRPGFACTHTVCCHTDSLGIKSTARYLRLSRTNLKGWKELVYVVCNRAMSCFTIIGESIATILLLCGLAHPDSLFLLP